MICPSRTRIRGCQFLFAHARVQCPTFTSSFSDSRRECGDPSKENGRMFAHGQRAPGSPGGGRPRSCVCTRLTATVAGVAVLLAVYPGRTDMTCQAHCSSTPDERMFCCVGEDPSPRLLLQEIPSPCFLSIGDPNASTQPWAHLRASQPVSAASGLDHERISRLQKSASQQERAEIGWQP